MPYYTYIIESESTGMLYIGSTNDIEDRVARHNEGRNKFTNAKGPWSLKKSICFETRAEAVQLEHDLKAMKSRDRVLRWIASQPG